MTRLSNGCPAHYEGNRTFRVFPNALKHAIVRPRLKKPSLNPGDVNTYQPISNLSFVLKIVERVIVNRFDEHIKIQHLLPDRKSAYRAMHDSIVRAIDSGDGCALVLLDLRSAFDTVDHETLMHVLQQRFEVEGPALTWFGSYMCDRTQAFCHDTRRSGPYGVDCSVPQGLVLGPKEFIAYTQKNWLYSSTVTSLVSIYTLTTLS